jgi:hypothetical protein
MSDGKNEIDYYDDDWNDIISLLIKRNYPPIMGEILKIDIRQKLLSIKNPSSSKIEILKYDNLISTLPAPLFYKLSGIKPLEDFKYASKIFVMTTKRNIDIGDYDYVYFPEKRYGFHRITKIGNERMCIEYTLINPNNENDRISHWCKLSYKTSSIKIGQIISGSIEKFDNIEFLGRYAEWNHDVKINDVIQKMRRI